MNKRAKGALKGVAAAVGLSGSFLMGVQNAPEKAPTELSLPKDVKRYVAYSRTELGKRADYKAAVRVLGSRSKSPLRGVNGFSFEAKDEEIVALRQGVAGLAGSWKIVEDRLYELDFFKGCERDRPEEFPPTEPVVPWGMEKIQVIEAYERATGKGVLVCVLDTGTDAEHPDIAGALAGGASFVDGVSSWDDDQGHGTHVAGTIAATLNDRDVVGAATGAKIYTGKVLDSTGRGYGSWIAAGVLDCVDAGAQVISMSLGSPAEYGPDPLITDAIDVALNAAVFVVAAAGNDGGRVGYPAAWPGVIAVSATGAMDELASFSSRGPEIDYAAPGVGVLSLKMGGGVVSYSGTSMATPHVSGVIALALSAGKRKIGVDDIGLPLEHQGQGRVNALKSVAP